MVGEYLFLVLVQKRQQVFGGLRDLFYWHSFVLDREQIWDDFAICADSPVSFLEQVPPVHP